MANERYLLQGRDSGVSPIPKYVSWWAQVPTDPYSGGYVPVGPIVDTVIVQDLGPKAGLQTALDIDFSSLPNQTFLTDGSYVVAGKTWTKSNSTNDQSPMAIVNGQGLVIQPKSTSDYNGGTRTFPMLSTPLLGLDPTLPLGARVRCYMHVSAQNITANYDNAVMGIDSGSAVAGYVAKYGRGVGGIGIATFIQANTSNLGFNDFVVALGSGSNVVCLDVARLGHPAIAGFYAPAGLTPPTIPLDSAFLYANSRDYATAAMSGLTPANMVFLLGAQRAGSGTALSITISRARVLWTL